MPDLAALLAAVIATPEDDAPRAAYAAAIAMTDPERAEMISLQLRIDASRKALRPLADRQAALVREEILIRTRGAEWAGPIAKRVVSYRYLRGFVEVIATDAATFVTTAADLYTLAPILHVDLTGVASVAARLFASPHLARLRSLDLRGNQLHDGDAVALAASPHLGNLRWLELSRNQLTERGVEALAASPNLPRLVYVGLRDNVVADPTPQHADEYDAETPLALALQAKHGKRPWLDATPRAGWPPERDALP